MYHERKRGPQRPKSLFDKLDDAFTRLILGAPPSTETSSAPALSDGGAHTPNIGMNTRLILGSDSEVQLAKARRLRLYPLDHAPAGARAEYGSGGPLALRETQEVLARRRQAAEKA